MASAVQEHVCYAVLLGPTAVGKTSISLEVAGGEFEILSADSVQVYRYLDIGSGKPEREERERIRHHLIDIVDPDYPFTAGEFCRMAERAAGEIVSRGKLPLIVGGTGLYIDSFFQGLSEIPEIPFSVRDDIRGALVERGLQSLFDELMQVDPAFGSRIHPNDTQRITRGLEVFRGTGKPLSSFYGGKNRYGSNDVMYIGLHEERPVLRKRIDDRVDRMMERGFVEEVRSLRDRGYGPGLKSMMSIGYAEINGFLDGKKNIHETVEAIKTSTKQYAKRQMTWFGKNKGVHWVKPGELEKIKTLLWTWLESSGAKINKNR